MGTNPRSQIEMLREQLSEGERGGCDADREVLLEFSDQMDLLTSEYSDHRHLKLLRHCTRMAENAGGLADALEDRDAAEAIVRWINRTYDNEETNRDYRSAIRVFGKRVTRSDEPPEPIAWIPTGTSRSYDPMPSAADMLAWDDEVQDLLDATLNERDRALIAVQYEAGLRSGECYDLTVGDVVDGEHALGLHVDGKTGQRAVHLVVSVPYLQDWLGEHPASDDGDAPLWSGLSNPDRISYAMFLKVFKEAASRAGVDKPVTPTNFRKSNTRWLVRQGMSQPEIEDRQGRERGSKHTARYMARFGEEATERQYAALHGRQVETDDPEETAPIACPRCGNDTPRERAACIHCNQSLDLEAAELIDELKAAVDERLVESEDVEDRKTLVTTREAVESNAGQMDVDDLHELVSSLSD